MRTILDNPLLIEYRRSMRRFIGVTKSGASSSALIIVVAVVYILFLAIVAMFGSDVDPVVIVQFQTFLFCITIPALIHGAIAGERERRTWDLLVASPLTNREIIYGKFVAGMMTQVIVVALMAPPFLLTMMIFKDSNWQIAIIRWLVSIAFGIKLGAVCMAISTHSKRAYTSQLLCYAYLVIVMLVFPMFCLMVSNGQPSPYAYVGQPFVVAGIAGDSSGNPEWTEAGHVLPTLSLIANCVVAATIIFALPAYVKSAEGEPTRRN